MVSLQIMLIFSSSEVSYGIVVSCHIQKPLVQLEAMNAFQGGVPFSILYVHRKW